MFAMKTVRGLFLATALAAAAAAAVVPTSVPAAHASVDTCPAALTYGTTAQCSIGVVKEVDAFTLKAAAGDSAVIHVVGATGSGLDVDFDIRDSAKKVVCAARAGSSSELVCPLPAAGTYVVSVFDSGNDETGRYRITTQRANKPVGASPVAVAKPIQALIGVEGEQDWYTFPGKANTTMVVRAATLAPSPIEADVDVFDTTGKVLCSSRAGTAAVATCALTTAGTYAFRVGDGKDDEMGAYAVTVRPECTITGTSGADTLMGTSGNDVICGLGGADKIDGGAGDDIIIGGTGNDTLDGGNGSDLFLSERTSDGADTISGGSGTDTISYIERGNAVSVDSDVKADDGEAKEKDDIRADVEVMLGGAGNDVLRGSWVNNQLFGGFGDDTLFGAGGVDQLDGGPGNDTCDVGADGGSKVACEK